MATGESEPQVKATPVTTRRLLLIWVLWTLATAFGMYLGIFSYVHLFPDGWFFDDLGWTIASSHEATVGRES